MPKKTTTRGKVHGALKPAAKIPKPVPPPKPKTMADLTEMQRRQLMGELNGGEG
jgi:hypothetical protein